MTHGYRMRAAPLAAEWRLQVVELVLADLMMFVNSLLVGAVRTGYPPDGFRRSQHPSKFCLLVIDSEHSKNESLPGSFDQNIQVL